MEIGLVFLWLSSGVVCMIIAGTKGRSGCGWFMLGALFGPFALVICALPSLKQSGASVPTVDTAALRKCPFCAERILIEAIKCKHCGSDLPPADVSRAPIAMPEIVAKPVAPVAAIEKSPEQLKRETRHNSIVIIGLVVFVPVLLAILAFAKLNQEKSTSNAGVVPPEENPVEACVGRGVKYFKEIDSFPTLSDGRHARDVATERCRRTIKAFE